MRDKVSLSVIIIAKDEEHNLDRCLRSLPKGVEIVLVDSMSQDRSCEIAESYGAKTFQRPFTNFAEQKNYALDQATGDWVLSLDADEELVSGCGEKLLEIIASSTESGYRLPRYLIFMGKRLRFGKTKDAPLRLFRRDKGRFEGVIHEKLVLNGDKGLRLADIKLLHYSYRDLSDYFVRFNRYTTEIAANHHNQGRKVPLSHTLRPLVEFISRYILRLGFLDGYAGYTYALISSLYAYIKYAKLKELELSHD